MVIICIWESYWFLYLALVVIHITEFSVFFNLFPLLSPGWPHSLLTGLFPFLLAPLKFLFHSVVTVSFQNYKSLVPFFKPLGRSIPTAFRKHLFPLVRHLHLLVAGHGPPTFPIVCPATHPHGSKILARPTIRIFQNAVQTLMPWRVLHHMGACPTYSTAAWRTALWISASLLSCKAFLECSRQLLHVFFSVPTLNHLYTPIIAIIMIGWHCLQQLVVRVNFRTRQT